MQKMFIRQLLVSVVLLFVWTSCGTFSTAPSFGLRLLWPAPPQAVAQFEGRVTSDDIFLLAPRSLQRLLSEGKSAIRDGRYAEGIAALGGILYEQDDSIPADLRGQDFFLFRPERGNYSQSLKSQAIQVLNELPDEGRKVLELQFGLTARRQLDEAIAKRDFQAIEEVARRFSHCQAGHDALLIVAQSKLSEGYPIVAADILQSLLDFPDARRRFGVRLAYMAAMAWLQAEKAERALATLELAVRDFAGQSLTIEGQQIPIENAAAVLSTARISPGEGKADYGVDNWLTMGGNASRNATSNLGVPLPNERWEWMIHSSRPEGQAIQEREESLRKSASYLLPRLELRVQDGLVMSRSNDSSLVGIDFDSGLLVWRRPSSEGVAPLKQMSWDRADKPLSTDLLNRVWGSTSFGRFTCDAKRCYQIVYSQAESPAMRGMAAVTASRLECISIERQGAILWSIGGEDSDEPELASAYFLGPPLPYGGQLYSLVEINGQVDLVVLSPESGKLQWRQQIATAPYLPVQVDAFRQSLGLTPSISDGVILCPTGVGGIVALDLLTRSFRWGATYPLMGLGSSRSGMNFPGGVFGSPDYNPLQSRWLDEGLIVDQGVVAVTPPEADLLLCYDLLSGEQLFSRRRNDACYVAGLHQSRIIVVYPNRVQAIDLQSRRSKWELEFPEGLSLCGKGLWLEGKLLLPLTNKTLIRVDLSQAALERPVKLAQPLGNLFAHRGQLLSVGPTSITCYHTREELEEQVEQRLAANPSDTWGLNHRSQLLISDGQYIQALELLLASFELRPDDDDTRYFLADTMLAGLRHDFDRFSKFTSRLDEVIRANPQLWFHYLQLLAQGMLAQGDYAGAFQRLWDLVRERHAAYVAGAMSRSSIVALSDQHTVDLDHWIAVELGRCYAHLSEDEKTQADQMIASELERFQGTILPVRRSLLKYVWRLPLVDEHVFRLAEMMMERDDPLGAEELLDGLSLSSSTESRSRAVTMLGHEYRLDKSLAQTMDRSVEQAVWGRGQVLPQLSRQGIHSVGRPTELNSQRFGRPQVSIAVSDRFLAFSDANGSPIYNLAIRQATSDLTATFMRSEMRGGLVLLETMSELIAVDFYRGFTSDAAQAVLWRYSLDSTSPLETFQPVHASFTVDELLGIATHRRRPDGRKYAAVGPLVCGVKVVQTSNQVLGLDAYTGKVLWTRDGYSDQVRFACSEQSRMLAIVDPKAGVSQRIDVLDGKLIDVSTYLVDEISQRMANQAADIWNHWYSRDDWLVDYRADENNRAILRVWSPLLERKLMEISLPKGARAGKTSDGLLAVLDPTGKLYVVDFSQAKLYPMEVAVDSRLSGIHLFRFGERLVIASNSSVGTGRLGQSPSDVLVHGYAYCFDLQTQQMAWSIPGRLTNMAIPLMQPRNSPFMAAFQPSADRTGSSSTPLVLIDLRDGRLASVVDGLTPEQTSNFSMRLFPDSQQIAMAIGEVNLRFDITDQSRPPEPVVHFGSTRKRTPEVIRDESSLFK